MQLSGLNPAGCTFLGSGDSSDLDTLEASLTLHHAHAHTQGHAVGGNGEGNSGGGGSLGPSGGVSAVFTEFPSNPLLRCPDLHR